jgi:hypothetical protein
MEGYPTCTSFTDGSIPKRRRLCSKTANLFDFKSAD